jgi:mannosyltransferase
VDAWDDWRHIMDVVAYSATPGDVVLDYPLVSALTVSYPHGLRGLPVLNAGRDRIARSYLWDERLPLSAVEDRLRGVRRVWYLAPSANEDDDRRRDADLARLRKLGFRRETLQKSPGEQTYLLTRTTAQMERGDRLLRTPG